MERQFETALKNLKDQLMAMAGMVERAIETAIEALQSNNAQKTSRVFELEKRIDRSHKDIDQSCLELLALNQPMAADLRLIIAVIKINTDLERMGDQAVNISQNSMRYLAGPPLKPLVDLPTMFTEVRIMVRDVLDAFVRNDEALARNVIFRDDLVDELKNKIFRDVQDHLKSKVTQVPLAKGVPEMIEQGLNLILIARNLERLGDHATNIAEDVIFALSGVDVRHGGAKKYTPQTS